MALLTNNAEGQSPGTVVAFNQSGSGDGFNSVILGGSGTAVYSADAEMHGNQSYYLTTTNTSGDTSVLEWNGNSTLTAATRFYVYYWGRPSGAMVLANFRNSTVAAASIVTTGSCKITLQDTVGTTLVTFSTIMYAGVWYRVELGVTVATSTTGSATLSYYLGDSTTAIESYSTTTSNFGTTNIVKAQYGKLTSTAASVTLFLDDLAFQDSSASFIGGFSPTASTPWLGV